MRVAELQWAGAAGQQPVWRGSSDGFRLQWAGLSLLLCNLLDGVFTLCFLQLTMAEEANPLMRAAYEQSPLTFMAFKLGAVHLGVWLLCLHQELKIARFGMRIGAALYGAVVLYHLGFLVHLTLR